MINSTLNQPLLEASNIVKEFSGVRVLEKVDFSVYSGEVLALCGENGAGKSTLMKILSGVYPAGSFQGEIRWKGTPVTFQGTKAAEKKGIAIIYQELNLFQELTVAENLYVGRYPLRTRAGLFKSKFFGVIDWDEIHHSSERILQSLGVSFSPSAILKDLSIGDQQMVEIAKALSKDAQLLIFDEPTSALSNREVERLFEIIQKLKARGTACVYISHKMDEVFHLADRVFILRDGKSVAEGSTKVTEASQSVLTPKDVIRLMVGRELDSYYPEKALPPEDAISVHKVIPEWNFQVKNLSSKNKVTGKSVVKDVSFSARKGEILGIAGMMGSGRSEILFSIFGHPDFEVEGEVILEGRKIPLGSIKDTIRSGIGLVTEDRKHLGVHLGMTIRENISMASLKRISKNGVVKSALEQERCERYMERLRIKAASSETLVGRLSGGNQQKVALAKWAAIHPKILFLDEPTRGVDVGAKYDIYLLLKELVDSGVCVIIVSSELPELVGICHRVIVVSEGHIAGELEGNSQVCPENVMRLAATHSRPLPAFGGPA
jgi:D-xylose transport system ATP-binding protein